MKTIRVSVKPWIYQGVSGWRVRWTDGNRVRAYFVQSYHDAKHVKARAKAGKNPKTGRWAVKV